MVDINDCYLDSAQSRQLTVARKTIKEHVLHWHQLYEQQKKKEAISEGMACILDCYVNRWQRWAVAGLHWVGVLRDTDQQNNTGLFNIADPHWYMASQYKTS
ncbi:MAG: hypothetical protein ACI9FD_004205 [Gammaproteobacteria bacterium]|jgi:hypothetical protein